MKTVRCAPPRRWGIAEWGSIASIIGIALWLYDKVKAPHDPSSAEPIEP